MTATATSTPCLIININKQRRALEAADWLVRVHLPAWLRAAATNERLLAQAGVLAGLPALTSFRQLPGVFSLVSGIWEDVDAAKDAALAAIHDDLDDDAWDSAWFDVNEAGSAAEAAVRAAGAHWAWENVRDAASNAVVASDIVRAVAEAAYCAARQAAWLIAYSAPKSKLQDTASKLLQSAVLLFEV